MLDTVAFIKRVETIFDYYAINAAVFADQIGVQRSSLSHLLSGRNKPSLDFILKIVDTYQEVDLNWILHGKGGFPMDKEVKLNSKTKPEQTLLENKAPLLFEKNSIQGDLFSELTDEPTLKPQTLEKMVLDEIDQIVFFYKNGDFKIYKSR